MFEKLPKKIPVFPLNGVIYFPKTNLPLNIFEERYLDLVKDILENDKMMGMVQSKNNSDDVYQIGCLGKISDYKKTSDGRVLINLTGLVRFEIEKEIINKKKYREFSVSYEKFNIDLLNEKSSSIDYSKLNYFINKTKVFFNKNGLVLNWDEFRKLDHYQQVNTLAMIAPVSNEEKQKLLESITTNEKLDALTKIIEFYLYENKFENKTIQ